MSIKIVSTGSHASDEILDNFMLSKIVDTNNQWIVERTGIDTRHVSKNITTEELGYLAAKKAIEKSGIDNDKIGLIIFASISSDTLVPSSAYTVSGKLGIKDCICFDLNAACSGFIYSMTVAENLMKSMNIEYGLVIGAEILTKYVDWKDRATCILFGDGAGCALLKNTEYKMESTIKDTSAKDIVENTKLNLENTKENRKTECKENYNIEIVDYIIGGKYDYNKYLSLKSRDSFEISDESYSEYISMNGRQIYKFATDIGVSVIEKLTKSAGITKDDIAAVIPHQANRRIVETLSAKSEIDIEKWFINLDKYGNTSAASVPIAMDEFLSNCNYDNYKGKYIITLAFGGGLTYGGILLKVHR